MKGGKVHSYKPSASEDETSLNQPSKTGRSCLKDETNNTGETSLTRQSEVWGRECPSICAEETHYFNREATKGRVGKRFCNCRCFVFFISFFLKLFSVF